MASQRAISPSYESYDSILETVKIRVQNALSLAKDNKSSSIPKTRTQVLNSDDEDLSESDDLDWEFNENSDAQSEELDAFRTDIPDEYDISTTQIIKCKTDCNINTSDVIEEEDLSKRFYQELKKSEILVDIQEKFLKRHFSNKGKESKIDSAMDVSYFLQEILADHGISFDNEESTSIVSTKETTSAIYSTGFEKFLPTKTPVFDMDSIK